jgi:nucleotide-binding universal stress UspA family protein
MRPIVCATRGGQASRRTQEQAIALAKERNTKLIFLCVTDPSFSEPADDALAEALADELRRLAKSLIYIAQARAREQGIEAEAVVQCGSVCQSIEDFLEEVDAQTLIIGSPQGDVSLRPFGADEMGGFIDTVKGKEDLEVIVVS